MSKRPADDAPDTRQRLLDAALSTTAPDVRQGLAELPLELWAVVAEQLTVRKHKHVGVSALSKDIRQALRTHALVTWRATYAARLAVLDAPAADWGSAAWTQRLQEAGGGAPAFARLMDSALGGVLRTALSKHELPGARIADFWTLFDTLDLDFEDAHFEPWASLARQFLVWGYVEDDAPYVLVYYALIRPLIVFHAALRRRDRCSATILYQKSVLNANIRAFLAAWKEADRRDFAVVLAHSREVDLYLDWESIVLPLRPQ